MISFDFYEGDKERLGLRRFARSLVSQQVTVFCIDMFVDSFDAEAADVNGDGEVNVGDVLALLSLIED